MSENNCFINGIVMGTVIVYAFEQKHWISFSEALMAAF